jgi:probable HAF family extracellular repeat protein
MTNRSLKNFFLVLLGFVGAVAIALGSSMEATDATANFYYDVTPLGILPGDDNSLARGINDAGQVVGVSGTNLGTQHAFFWENGSMTPIGTLGGTESVATGINNSGTVAGYAQTSDGSYHAFTWRDGTFTDLGTNGSNGSYAYAINDAGKVAGSLLIGFNQVPQAVSWNNNNGITILGDLNSNAEGINNPGKVVGTMSTSSGYDHAFLWYKNGTRTDLGTLGGVVSIANGINEAGKVIGSSLTSNGIQHAALWQNGSITDLGTLGGNTSYASGINNAGKVVGTAQTSTGVDHAFLWYSGIMTDLNSKLQPNSGWVLSSAWAINNSGQIVGFGAYQGHNEAFLLTPVSVT